MGLLVTSLVYSLFIGNHYRLAGFLTVVSYGIAMVLSFGLKEVKKETKGQEPDPMEEFVGVLKTTIKNRQLFCFLLGIAIFNEVHQTVTVFLSQLQYVRAGIGNSMMGILYGLLTVLSLCSFYSDKWTKRMGEHRMMLGCFFLALCSCGILTVTKNPVLSVGAIVLLRIGFSLAQPLQQELQNRQISTENRATALSVQSVFMDSIGIGTNMIFGALAEKSLSISFGFGTFSMILAVILYLTWKSAEQT